ncbi:conserved hypothetical protein [Roseibium sp. TrichSKD4]|uniref:DUF3995 domain-containing protein n=1 Tax=Roseibium sp. TrichSKD4 TaxID=744980 RepID=UPI0001E56694|nr:DUF3995 domain-containing protein [Roseibium sp. TrichSKD4]EFO32779.1 conserved hypothetical protein [Roseibium sp. TrichSKD4]
MIQTTLAFLLFLVLSITAGLHVYWAFGGFWPAVSLEDLPKTVIGAKGITQMPPTWMTLVVAALIFAAAVAPLVWVGIFPLPIPQLLVLTGMMGLTGVFLLRGVVGFTPYFGRLHAEEPFRTLDRLYFSPLCIAIGLVFLAVLLLKSTASQPSV